MTEIPEHLLKRSKERKAALSGEAAPADDSDAGTAVEPAAEAAPVPAAAAAVPDVAAEPEPAKPVAPYVEKATARKTMPYWIVPVLLALPVWGAFYVGTLERVPQGLTGLLGHGEELYVEAGCSGCHGAEGGGGIGPTLADGEVHLTFTSIEDQVVWIAKGSSGWADKTNYASPNASRQRPVVGQMPGYAPIGGSAAQLLNAEDLLAVTLYERTQLEPGEAANRDLEVAAILNEMIETGNEELELPEEYDASSLTAEDVARWLEPVRAELIALEG